MVIIDDDNYDEEDDDQSNNIHTLYLIILAIAGLFLFHKFSNCHPPSPDVQGQGSR